MTSVVDVTFDRKGPLILDGGLATELEAQGLKLEELYAETRARARICLTSLQTGDPLWSARVLHTNPQAIRDAHLKFLLHGADVITTATYQATMEGFIKHMDMSSDSASTLLMSGVHLARDAVKQFVSDHHPTDRRYPLVAGSVGAYGAFLHDGSEYTGVYAKDMSIEELKAWHRPQISCLVAAGADLIAMETIPSIKEAEALVELLREFPNSKAWLSFSCKDGTRISDGSLFAEAVQIANRSKQLIAVGVNCCSPTLVKPLLDSAKSLLSPELFWVVYPNSGVEWDAQSKSWTASQNTLTLEVLSSDWMKQGAALIGGCCFIGPADIAKLRQQLLGTHLPLSSLVS